MRMNEWINLFYEGSGVDTGSFYIQPSLRERERERGGGVHMLWIIWRLKIYIYVCVLMYSNISFHIKTLNITISGLHQFNPNQAKQPVFSFNIKQLTFHSWIHLQLHHHSQCFYNRQIMHILALHVLSTAQDIPGWSNSVLNKCILFFQNFSYVNPFLRQIYKINSYTNIKQKIHTQKQTKFWRVSSPFNITLVKKAYNQ